MTSHLILNEEELFGIDYSSFHPLIKQLFEKETQKTDATSVYKRKLQELKGIELLRLIVDCHTSLSFQEAYRGAKNHLSACEAQYKKRKVAPIKKTKWVFEKAGYVQQFVPYTVLDTLKK